MAMHTPIVAGVFEQESQARSALNELTQAGFEHNQIGVATLKNETASYLDDLQSLGFSREHALYYDQALSSGHIVVSVRADDHAQDVLDILRRHGASDYDQSSASPQEALPDPTMTDRHNTDDASHTLRLREEQLQVSKEKVQTGEVQLRKEIVTEQKTITVPVSHEEVVIEQHPVTNGQVDTTPLGEDQVIRIPITEEQISVTKTPVVTGEVKLGKRLVQETQQVSDTLQREEARLEQSGDVHLHTADDESPAV